MSDIITYLDGASGVTEKIKKAMYNAAREFVYIGFLLWEVQEYEYFKEKNYHDVYEYAERELSFKRSSTKNFIAICKEFSHSETKHNGSASSIGRKVAMTIAEPYEKFNYSQLTEMLSMSPAQRKQVTPEMTVKQIREIKREAAAELKADNFIIADYEIKPDQIEAPVQEPITETKQTKETKQKKSGQTSGQKEILIIPDSSSRPQNKSPSTLSCDKCFYLKDANSDIDYRKVKTDESILIHATVNNVWKDIPLEVIEILCQAAGLKKTKSMCFDIEIEVHKNE